MEYGVARISLKIGGWKKYKISKWRKKSRRGNSKIARKSRTIYYYNN